MDDSRDGIAMPRKPNDLAKLIRKLRWVGLEDDARRLQLAMLTLPRGQRSVVLAGPSETD